MKLIRPIEITDSNLTSSNVAADTTPEWDIATTYAQGDVVRVESVHKLYESQTAGNVGNDPLTDNINWLDIGSTNRWAMFDDVVGTTTTNTESIEVVVEPGRINSLGLLNISANSLYVKLEVGSVIVYERSETLSLANISNWYEYYYEPVVRKTDVVFTDIPQYGDGVLTVRLSGNPTDTIECGLFIVGLFKLLGTTQWGVNSGIISYSQKEANQFGGFEVVKRDNSKRMEVDIFMLNNQVDETQRILSEYDSVPVLWVGYDMFQVTIIYGFYKDFTVVLTNPGGSHCSLTVEGLI